MQRCGAQTATMATRMYLHGGADVRQAYGDLHLLEIEHMKWSELQTEGQAPSPRYGHSLHVHGIDLVVFGGSAADSAATALLSDDNRQAGPQTPPFISTPWGHAGRLDNTTFVLNTQTLKWRALGCVGHSPSPRFYHSACVVGDVYVIFGGCASPGFNAPLGDLFMLDLVSSQWTAPNFSGQVPSPRFAHKMIAGPEDQLFVFGGASTPYPSEAVPGTLYSYKMATATWSVVQVVGTPPLERSFHTFDLIGNLGFVFAGMTSTSISDLYILDLPNLRWARPLYEGQVNVRAHASAVLHDKLIVFGGVRDRDKAATPGAPLRRGPSEPESRISKKLFFLNVLEVKSGVGESDFKFKLVSVGDSGVGKSCLLTRFVQDFYADFHASTIGVDFKNVITMVKGRLVKLQLWDTAGQERFSVVTGNYYRNSDGFIFVYDSTSRASFDHVDQWLTQVQQHHDCGPGTIKILIGNKTDLVNELSVTEEEGRAKAEQMDALFVATSAKTAANVDMAFLTAAQSLVENRKRPDQRLQGQGQGHVLNPGQITRPNPTPKSRCCGR